MKTLSATVCKDDADYVKARGFTTEALLMLWAIMYWATAGWVKDRRWQIQFEEMYPRACSVRRMRFPATMISEDAQK